MELILKYENFYEEFYQWYNRWEAYSHLISIFSIFISRKSNTWGFIIFSYFINLINIDIAFQSIATPVIHVPSTFSHGYLPKSFSDYLILLNHNFSYSLRTTQNTGTLGILHRVIVLYTVYLVYIFYSFFLSIYVVSFHLLFVYIIHFKQISSYFSTFSCLILLILLSIWFNSHFISYFLLQYPSHIKAGFSLLFQWPRSELHHLCL